MLTTVERARHWLIDDMGDALDDDATAITARMVALAITPKFVPDESYPYPPTRWSEFRIRALNWLANESATLPLNKQLPPGCDDRLATMAADLLTSAPLAPPVQLSRYPIGTYPKKAIVFSAWPHATHELWPCMIDAIMFGDAVAVHDTWLDGDAQATRSIAYDPTQNRFVEADLSTPMHIERALLLLGRVGNETVWHESVADALSRAGTMLLNPASAALLADDKWTTFEAWSSAGVPTPETERVTAKDSGAWFAEFGDRHQIAGAMVVKPRHGTGAKDVCIVEDAAGVVKAVERVLLTDDAIVQPFCGAMRAPNRDSEMCTAVLRLNVASDGGGTCRVESGYVHVACDPDSTLASLARGGHHAPIVRENLIVGGSPLSVDDVRHIIEVAEAAARVVMASTGTRILGIDLVAERDESGGVRAYALEANSRPAGLARSRLLSRDWESMGEPGVSTRMWE